MHGSLFEDFITHGRKDRYNLICYIVAHDKKQHYYEDEAISIGNRLIPKHVTTEALEVLGSTFNSIEIWLKVLDKTYDARRESYSTSTKETFKTIPIMITEPIIRKLKFHKLMI